jgi:hypothetical protein
MGARARIITAALCAAFATTQAAGQTTAYAPGDGTPNSLQLNIPVTASVGVACGFSTAPSGTHNEPDFDTHAWSHDFPFTLDCSIASRVAVVSTNGALLTGGAAPAGYTTSAPYDVALHVVQNSGSADATCAVANLQTGGSCSFRGPASAGLGGAGLNVAVSQNQPGSYLRVSAPAYSGANVLVASPGYADTLVVTLSPAA